MDETQSVPVEFKPLPPEPGREQVLSERRHYSRLLAEAAAELKTTRELLYVDSLTGLFNRAMFERELPRLMELARENHIPLAMVIVDIDGLKRTNDSLGHPHGDALIKSVGEAFKSVVRPDDIVGRFGGDEFYMLLPGYEPMPGQTIEDLNTGRKKRMNDDFKIAARAAGIPDELHVGLSAGFAELEEGDTPETLTQRADQDLRAIKGELYKSLDEQGISFHDRRLTG